MPRTTLPYAAVDVDWTPLQSIVGEADLGNWMWMHCDTSPASGEVVHFYKQVWSRRYLRVDHEGRAYRELDDGTPVALPGCGGGTLVALLALASAPYDDGMPCAITLPEAAREPTRIDDLPALAAVFQLVADDLFQMAEDVDGYRSGRVDHEGSDD